MTDLVSIPQLKDIIGFIGNKLLIKEYFDKNYPNYGLISEDVYKRILEDNNNWKNRQWDINTSIGFKDTEQLKGKHPIDGISELGIPIDGIIYKFSEVKTSDASKPYEGILIFSNPSKDIYNYLSKIASKTIVYGSFYYGNERILLFHVPLKYVLPFYLEKLNSGIAKKSSLSISILQIDRKYVKVDYFDESKKDKLSNSFYNYMKGNKKMEKNGKKTSTKWLLQKEEIKKKHETDTDYTYAKYIAEYPNDYMSRSNFQKLRSSLGICGGKGRKEKNGS